MLLDHFPDFVDVARLPVGRHSHHLVLAFIDLKSEECRESAIKQTDGVWKFRLAD